MPPRHRCSADGPGTRRPQWLAVLVVVAAFAAASLQPSYRVAEVGEAQLIAASGVDLAELPRDAGAAREWLAALGFPVDGFGDGSLEDFLARFFPGALPELPPFPSPGLPTTTVAPPTTVVPPTTTVAPPTTTVVPPTTTVVPPTTTVAPPPSTSTTWTIPTTTIPTTTVPVTTIPATTTTVVPPTTTTVVPAAPIDEAAERRFVQLINEERTAQGLAALDVDLDIRTVARDWSRWMAGRGVGCTQANLAHNPSFASQMPLGWTRVAENVACGSSVASIHAALMSSPGHRANILDPGFTDLGVGVAVGSGGTLWVTQNFGAY